MDKHSITDNAVAAFGFDDARTAELLHGLIRHLHDYARNVQLTHEEWRAGLDFLTRAAGITDRTRNEFSLLSDVLGLSSLVDLIATPAGATPGSVLGPFHVHDSQYRADGHDLKAGQAGRSTLFTGRVLTADGQPLQADIDFWQNADNGMYPQQDDSQDYHNLRCKLKTQADGRFALRTVLPQPYGIPEDGPVGDIMRAAKRSCMRPAHFHLIITAPGYRTVVTELFFERDPHLGTDAVFGVRPQLIVPVREVNDPGAARECHMPSPFLKVDYDFRLAASGVSAV